MNTTTKIISVLFIVIVAGFLFNVFTSPKSQKLIATASYSCNMGRSISAVYYQGEGKPASSPDQPPTPNGSVAITLSDGRTMTLPQTISADGGRYTNTDESFVFWAKGNGVLVLENDQEKSYIGCIVVAPLTEGQNLSQVYSNGAAGFSIRLPSDYTIDNSYQYKELGPGRDIPGIKFTIPASVTAGTNLAKDSYVSVEEIPFTNPQADTCSANLFLDTKETLPARTMSDGGTEYSVASSTGAGAGNRYEETVYALPGTSASRRTCIAVRYFIHYSVFENYPAGAVREFDKQSLTNQFDAIRHALIIAQ